MEIVIAGGHGKIALLTERLLTDAGHTVRALIRNSAHDADVQATGAQPVVADLERLEPAQLASLLHGADAVVYAAGAGPGSGPERKWTVDYGGAVKLIEACTRVGVDRYVIVSGRGADADAPDDGGFGTYLRAKGKADAELQASGLQSTVLRPVGLTDEPASDAISTEPDSGIETIPRADVAAAIVAVLGEPRTAGLTIVLRSGSETVTAAIESLLQ
jgi:uncharacterized protein YbjT (DUF2867 family)